jgi:anti-anti-sigma factor
MPETTPRHVTSRTEQGVLVLALTEPQLRGDSLVRAVQHEMLTAVQQAGTHKVVIDCQRLASLSSEGLRPLLTLRRKLQDAGGRLVLCNLSPGVESTFHATRLISTNRTTTTAFEVFPAVSAAVAALNSPPAEK